MFMPLIRKRRSIRKYLDKAVEAEKIDLLVEAALRAPSSRGFNPWAFIVLTDREMLKRLAASKPHGASFLARAPLGIVVCGDTRRSDVWVEDTSIACTYIQLAAESLDLGSCWIQIRERKRDDGTNAGDFIAGLLEIPPGFNVESIIAVGYPAETKPPHEKGELQFEKVHVEAFGKHANK
jgi:nitroreductase